MDQPQNQFRWAAWAGGVLSRVGQPQECLAAIQQRQEGVDDAGEADLVAAGRGCFRCRGYQAVAGFPCTPGPAPRFPSSSAPANPPACPRSGPNDDPAPTRCVPPGGWWGPAPGPSGSPAGSCTPARAGLATGVRETATGVVGKEGGAAADRAPLAGEPVPDTACGPSRSLAWGWRRTPAAR
jgi:hypothetical protein